MSSKNSQHVALCVTAQHFLKMSKTSKYNMYRYWNAVSVGGLCTIYSIVTRTITQHTIHVGALEN